MFVEITALVDDGHARCAPFMYNECSPINIKVWICASCLKLAPAIGFQKECPPTDWEKTEVEMPKGHWYKKCFFLQCPECKEEDKL